ncbi:hypothetical protein ACS0TY_006202 [Phlomoides rotata]
MKTTDILVLIMLVNSVLLATDARRLNAFKSLFVVIKEGPSPGEGHKIINAHTLGEGIKDSGDNYVNATPLQGVEDSGSSSGAGH